MSAHPFLECDDLDAVLSRIATNLPDYTRPAKALPSDPVARAEISAAIDSDHAAWESLLFQTLFAISAETHAFETGILLHTKQPEVDFGALERINVAPYVDHFSPDEVKLVAGAAAKIWQGYKDSRLLQVRIPAVFRLLETDGLKEENIRKLKGETRQFVRRLAAKTEQGRRAFFTITKYAVLRANGVREMKVALEVLRDFFKATDTLRNRLRSEANSVPAQTVSTRPIDIEIAVEGARLQEELQRVLCALCVDPAKAARLSDAQVRNVVWYGWRCKGMGVAAIRDKWNSEYPSQAVANGKDGTSHVRQGITRGKTTFLALAKK